MTTFPRTSAECPWATPLQNDLWGGGGREEDQRGGDLRGRGEGRGEEEEDSREER